MNRARPMATRLKNKNKSRVNLEPRSAHGRAVKNKNKSRIDYEPRSAHGRAVNKPRVDYEPRSAHGRAVNYYYSKFTNKGE